MRVSGTAVMTRTLHLVDADNLLGDPSVTDRRTIVSVFDAYRRAAGHRPGDHTVLATGCNARHVIEVELAWPTSLHRRRPGRDGADLALIDEAIVAAGRRNYARVVIGSGDHIFVPTIRLLQTAGCDVTVVAPRRSVAFDVRATGVTVVDLDPVLLALAA